MDRDKTLPFTGYQDEPNFVAGARLRSEPKCRAAETSGPRALYPSCVLERFGVAANATDMEELYPGFASPELNEEHEQLKTHELLFGMVL